MNIKDLVIIGSGPYGLAVAAYAKHLDLDFTLLGPPMGFWRDHMPRGLLLRSPTDWHIDSVGGHSLDDFVETKGLRPRDVFPTPADLFLEYTDWFQVENDLSTDSRLVKRLVHRGSHFEIELQDDKSIAADNVVVTSGLVYFQHFPRELVEIVPKGQLSHACETVDFEFLRNKNVLVIGGRMTAFEWAVLMSEQANAQVHVVHRHDTPPFEPSDFSWMYPEVGNTTNVRGWFRNLPESRQKAIDQRFYLEGRLKMEPWLGPRLKAGGVRIRGNASMISCAPGSDEKLQVGLDDGTSLDIDHVLLATGYKIDISRVPYLARGNVLDALDVVEGSPVLDEDFQSSIPGLFFTGIAAVRDFGPYFGFVVGSPSAGRVIGRKLERSVLSRPED